MRTMTWALVAAAVLTGGLPAIDINHRLNAAEQVATLKKKPIVQIAILLDTSSSMDGLIGQAKTQLWKVVNEFAKAQRDGHRPDIEVALYQYGTPTLGKDTGYIKQLVPLSTDLDKVSEELFKLKTNGGDEFCGAVIKAASESLKWSDDKSAYKAIFIAGNEPFTQGSVNYEDACKEAIAKGIVINTIHCGSESDGINGKWKDGAALADGSFMCIDQNAPVVHIAAPQDKELAELGAKINTTYVAYGKNARAGATNQAAQDLNSASASPASAAERSVTKATTNYRNGNWDLVDAARDNKEALKDVSNEDLPEEMKKLDAAGREKYIADKQKERADIQTQILKLNTERENFLAENTPKNPGEKTLDTAIVETVHTQAKKAGMDFDTPKETKK